MLILTDSNVYVIKDVSFQNRNQNKIDLYSRWSVDCCKFLMILECSGEFTEMKQPPRHWQRRSLQSGSDLWCSLNHHNHTLFVRCPEENRPHWWSLISPKFFSHPFLALMEFGFFATAISGLLLTLIFLQYYWFDCTDTIWCDLNLAMNSAMKYKLFT